MVLPVPAVRQLGGTFLRALNSMQIPKGMIEAMANPPAPRMPRYFADGGPVGDVAARGSAFAGEGGNHYHFHMDATDLLSEDQIRRKVIPVLDKITRRSK